MKSIRSLKSTGGVSTARLAPPTGPDGNNGGKTVCSEKLVEKKCSERHTKVLLLSRLSIQVKCVLKKYSSF